MNIISIDKIKSFCIEVCCRIGDEYTGPNMFITQGGVTEVTFYGKENKYKATLTTNGVRVFDEAGKEVANIPDIKSFLS